MARQGGFHYAGLFDFEDLKGSHLDFDNKCGNTSVFLLNHRNEHWACLIDRKGEGVFFFDSLARDMKAYSPRLAAHIEQTFPLGYSELISRKQSLATDSCGMFTLFCIHAFCCQKKTVGEIEGVLDIVGVETAIQEWFHSFRSA